MLVDDVGYADLTLNNAALVPPVRTSGLPSKAVSASPLWNSLPVLTARPSLRRDSAVEKGIARTLA
jgi:hypothetical protein